MSIRVVRAPNVWPKPKWIATGLTHCSGQGTVNALARSTVLECREISYFDTEIVTAHQNSFRKARKIGFDIPVLMTPSNETP